MAKILSAKEASYQKKLFPLNIFVLIISLAAALSLVFAPLVKVDVGKFLREKTVIDYADETLTKLINDNIDKTTDDGFRLDFTPIVVAAVSEVLGKAEGDITFSTFEVCRYAADKREDKLEILLDGMIYGGRGLVTELVNSLVSGIADAFTTEEGKAVVEDAMVDSVISSMGDIVSSVGGDDSTEIGEVLNEKLTDEKVGELKTTFFKINDAKSEEDVVEVIDTFVGQLNETLGDDYNISDEDKAAVTDYIVDIYNDTIEAIADSGEENEFSLEAMICVAVSQNVDLGEININELLKQYIDELNNSTADTGVSAVRKTLTDEVAETSDTPLTYKELFGEVGLSDEDVEEISESVNKLVKTYVDDGLEGVNEDLKSFGWVYDNIYLLILAVLALFALPWFILALTALIRSFTKNKRYSMWYVKLFGFIPALLFVVLFVLKTWGTTLIPMIAGSVSEDTMSLIMAAISKVSSFTWICGLCYILLWLVSIFWAFPIKHKIRKERKACKRAFSDGSYDYERYKDDYGYAVTKKEFSDDAYGGDYGDDDYDDDSNEKDYGFDDDYSDYDDDE